MTDELVSPIIRYRYVSLKAAKGVFMQGRKTLSVLSVVVLWSGTALAQDPVEVDPAHYKVVLENPSVRVLKISDSAGDKSPMHQHPDSTVVVLSASKVRFATPGTASRRTSTWRPSRRWSRPPGKKILYQHRHWANRRPADPVQTAQPGLQRCRPPGRI